MNVMHLLSARIRERSNLLAQITSYLHSEPGVCAAWVSGSVSHGNDDALSDLDIHVVVDDQSIGGFIENRKLNVAQPARPILLMDNFANAPIGGAYLLALYKGEAGPQHVDWFWQPVLGTRLPDDERILFDRVGLADIPGDQWRREAHRPPGPPLGSSPSHRDLLAHKISFFWAMSLIVAKYIARRNGPIAARMTNVIACTLDDIVNLMDEANASSDFRDSLPPNLAETSAETQFNLLRELALHAEALGNRLITSDVPVPLEAIKQIHSFFYLTEELAVRSLNP